MDIDTEKSSEINENKSEKVYDSLNKAFNSSFSFIKYALYPVGILLSIILIIGIWWGIDIKNSKNDIENSKHEINNIQSNLELEAQKIELSSREFQIKAKDSYDSLATQFKDFKSQFKQIDSEFSILKKKYESAIDQNDKLFNQLKSDNRSLSDFSESIRKSISTYTYEIKYAQKGIDQRKKDIETILTKRNEELERVQKTIVLLAEYLVLVQMGRNQFPDPNTEREIKLINQMLYTLVPDQNQRNEIIKKLNEIANPKK